MHVQVSLELGHVTSHIYARAKVIWLGWSPCLKMLRVSHPQESCAKHTQSKAVSIEMTCPHVIVAGVHCIVQLAMSYGSWWDLQEKSRQNAQAWWVGWAASGIGRQGQNCNERSGNKSRKWAGVGGEEEEEEMQIRRNRPSKSLPNFRETHKIRVSFWLAQRTVV